MSSSAASCSTSCRRGSTASVITACSPVPPARRILTTSVSCSGLRRLPPPTHLSTHRISGRHAHAAADTWSSSRPSSVSASPARRRLLRRHPGAKRRDPARPISDRPRSASACGAEATCADRFPRSRHPKQNRATSAPEPTIAAKSGPPESRLVLASAVSPNIETGLNP